MNGLEYRNQKIINAVIEKEKALCPGTIALIGIYGSFLTGDIHPLSDLDLLILINDDRGWQLGTSFIQDDLGVGHDIYCTDWESLRRDACYEHPHIAKLMDSRIVYCAEAKYLEELESLREQVRKKMAEPFGAADLQRAEKELKEAQCCYAQAMTAEDMATVRRHAGGMIYYTENAVALLNKTYFQKGVRRRYEELNAMEKRPVKLCAMIDDILTADAPELLKERITSLMRELTVCFQKAEQALKQEKKPADAETLSGTYEEMFSNWHGKMLTAAQYKDRHLAFMSLESMNEMLNDIAGEADIGSYDVLSVYDPEDLDRSAAGCDLVLRDYLKEYEKAGLKPERYADIDSFISAYLKPIRHT
ncbi:MAG: nucleotidyltransferase domain-containing protein [Clostridia bacterium]|nr:nucleotidyltransferase domain-containing protein [Clostridia bacterium]